VSLKTHRSRHVRIGTLVRVEAGAGQFRGLLRDGFESFALNFGRQVGPVNLRALAAEVNAALAGSAAVVSCLSVYGNPLAPGATGRAAIRDWQRLIDHAHRFGTDLVTGFAGRLPGASVEDSLPAFQKVFGTLAKRAADHGVRLAFENCPTRGNWFTGDRNIAFHPAAWEKMFDAVPAQNLGIEWDPSHPLCQLQDPLPQLHAWLPRIFHLHAKDAQIHPAALRRDGILGPNFFAVHRFPGLGVLDWAKVFRRLLRGGYSGCVDIEGWHDPVFCGPREMEGQRRALRYLHRCRARAR